MLQKPACDASSAEHECSSYLAAISAVLSRCSCSMHHLETGTEMKMLILQMIVVTKDLSALWSSLRQLQTMT